jgi:hypothetical protein
MWFESSRVMFFESFRPMDKNKLVITFDLSEVKNKFLLHLKDVLHCVTHVYHAIDKYEIDKFKPLPTDSFPVEILDNQTLLSPNEQKEVIYNWLLTKAFEDLIIGLFKSLKEVYKYLRYFHLCQNHSHLSEEELNLEFEKISVEVEKFHFPQFLNKIKDLTNMEIPFEEEILTINRVRNCLVHRHGIVGEKDFNSDSKDFKLKWISRNVYVMIDGKETRMTFELRKNGVKVNQINIKEEKCERTFRLGEMISINLNEFNGIVCNCIDFTHRLFELMPKPTNVNGT